MYVCTYVDIVRPLKSIKGGITDPIYMQDIFMFYFLWKYYVCTSRLSVESHTAK